MTSEPFLSFAQNAEDVVLYRALRHIDNGRYLEIGANHATVDSISRAFYDRGWSGVTVEPVAELIAEHRSERPRDIQVEAVAGPPGVTTAVLHEVSDTGLSSTLDRIGDIHRSEGHDVHDLEVPSATVDQILAEAGFEGDLHFVVIDTEGTEAAVLEGFDLARWRPWVLVIEATEPNSTRQSHSEWESTVLAAGYEFCLFDGLSRFYVAAEHAEQLRARLSYPSCPMDHYVPHEVVRLRSELTQLNDTVIGLRAVRAELLAQIRHWRRAALDLWAEPPVVAEVSPVDGAELVHLRDLTADLIRDREAMRRTLSWRVTRPLRAVSSVVRRIPR